MALRLIYELRISSETEKTEKEKTGREKVKSFIDSTVN